MSCSIKLARKQRAIFTHMQVNMAVLIEFTDDLMNKIGFVERNLMYLKRTLDFVRRDINQEISDLLPNAYKFVKSGRTSQLPVSSKQEAVITLAACVGLSDCDIPEQIRVVLKSVSTKEGSSNTGVKRSIECGFSGLESPKGKSAKIDTLKPIRDTSSRLTLASARSRGSEAVSVGDSALKKTIDELKRDRDTLQYEHDVLMAKLNSLTTKPAPRPFVGTQKFTCSICHNKGHKANRPCRLEPCKGFHICGQMDLHEEHKKLKNETESALKSCEKQLQSKNAEIKSAEVFKERTKANFFSIVRPRLIDCDPILYSNKVTLQKDLMSLAQIYKHKIPPQDADLKNALSKAKSKKESYLGLRYNNTELSYSGLTPSTKYKESSTITSISSRSKRYSPPYFQREGNSCRPDRFSSPYIHEEHRPTDIDYESRFSNQGWKQYGFERNQESYKPTQGQRYLMSSPSFNETYSPYASDDRNPYGQRGYYSPGMHSQGPYSPIEYRNPPL